jgi:protein disulfide-isomerase
MKTLLLSICALLASATITLAKTGWEEDYEKSLTKAKEDQKMVLLDFTGSDWCGYCIKLDEDVFSKSAFKKFAKESLVLVELDYPRGKSLPKKIKEQNEGLKDKYGINGYPTIILLDSEGKEAARWVGYKATLLDELKAKVKAPSKDSTKSK